MKTMMVAMISMLVAGSALADGFTCTNADETLNVKVFNNTDRDAGTRNAAVMVLSDPTVSSGRKTIARFTDVNGTISQSGAEYTADVDHRFNDSGRKGELILGTKIAYIKSIDLNIDFTYASPVAHGKELAAELSLIKRNGEIVSEGMICKRYLKN